MRLRELLLRMSDDKAGYTDRVITNIKQLHHHNRVPHAGAAPR
jgi:hypothetical protein